MKSNQVAELIAAQLHREYRAAFIAMHSGYSTFMGVGRQKAKTGTGCRNEHDHGWSNCPKKKYFLQRANMHIKRAHVQNPETLDEAEQILAATVFLRRLSAEGKLVVKVPTAYATGGIITKAEIVTINGTCCPPIPALCDFSSTLPRTYEGPHSYTISTGHTTDAQSKEQRRAWRAWHVIWCWGQNSE